jgi:hypothetical protein
LQGWWCSWWVFEVENEWKKKKMIARYYMYVKTAGNDSAMMRRAEKPESQNRKGTINEKEQ